MQPRPSYAVVHPGLALLRSAAAGQQCRGGLMTVKLRPGRRDRRAREQQESHSRTPDTRSRLYGAERAAEAAGAARAHRGDPARQAADTLL